MMGSAFTTLALAIWAIVCAAGALLGR
jgi:hypothetical protein